MNRFHSSLLVLAALSQILVAQATAQAASDAIQLVNPFIGTTNGGNVFPGATVPFGMVQFSPEASPWREKSPIAAPGGYEYRATKIRGFSLTNVEGWGCAGASGDIPIMPVTGSVTRSPSLDFRNEYASGFLHEHEEAHPGYYRVTLENGVAVELSATLHTGVALFRYPEGATRTILIRTSDSEVGSTAATTVIDAAARTVSGSVTSGNFCGYIDKADRRSYYTLYLWPYLINHLLQQVHGMMPRLNKAQSRRPAEQVSDRKAFLKKESARAAGSRWEDPQPNRYAYGSGFLM